MGKALAWVLYYEERGLPKEYVERNGEIRKSAVVLWEKGRLDGMLLGDKKRTRVKGGTTGLAGVLKTQRISRGDMGEKEN